MKAELKTSFPAGHIKFMADLTVSWNVWIGNSDDSTLGYEIQFLEKEKGAI